MPLYTVYWDDGDRMTCRGPDPITAIQDAGFGSIQLSHIQALMDGDDHSYEWNADRMKWERIQKSEGDKTK